MPKVNFYVEVRALHGYSIQLFVLFHLLSISLSHACHDFSSRLAVTPHYFRHCALNPNTLITKFLGMYRVKLYHLRRNVKFVVMKSVYDTDKHLHQVFDVKGSSTGRDAKPGEAVKKDNDVRRSLPDGAFVLEDSLRDRLRMQVERDCQWLKAMKIMDYSMLSGVHNIIMNGNGPSNRC
jgi:hypothetical protein